VIIFILKIFLGKPYSKGVESNELLTLIAEGGGIDDRIWDKLQCLDRLELQSHKYLLNTITSHSSSTSNIPKNNVSHNNINGNNDFVPSSSQIVESHSQNGVSKSKCMISMDCSEANVLPISLKNSICENSMPPLSECDASQMIKEVTNKFMCSSSNISGNNTNLQSILESYLYRNEGSTEISYDSKTNCGETPREGERERNGEKAAVIRTQHPLDRDMDIDHQRVIESDMKDKDNEGLNSNESMEASVLQTPTPSILSIDASVIPMPIENCADSITVPMLIEKSIVDCNGSSRHTINEVATDIKNSTVPTIPISNIDNHVSMSSRHGNTTSRIEAIKSADLLMTAQFSRLLKDDIHVDLVNILRGKIPVFTTECEAFHILLYPS
jgi:hypothetical protein